MSQFNLSTESSAMLEITDHNFYIVSLYLAQSPGRSSHFEPQALSRRLIEMFRSYR